jgi:hypothetical protein
MSSFLNYADPSVEFQAFLPATVSVHLHRFEASPSPHFPLHFLVGAFILLVLKVIQPM